MSAAPGPPPRRPRRTRPGWARRSRPVPVEFHISREARERYDVDEALFAASGNVIFPNIAAARRLAQAMRAEAGQLVAMGLIDEILHALVDRYREEVNPRAIAAALGYVESRCGVAETDRTLEAFAERFPTVGAMRDGTPAATWLAAETEGTPNRVIALEELLLLWLANANPAFAPFEELFDDGPLLRTAYDSVIAGLAAYFATQPPLDGTGLTLIEALRAPALEVPDSLAGQLRFIRERFGLMLDRFLDRLVVGLDVLLEEQEASSRRFAGQGGGPEDPDLRASRAWLLEAGWYGHGPARTGQPEPERFSLDLEWMPRLVLVAKSTYVWLDQLSKAYGRDIGRLDQIPDEELDRLARLGFTGLWLIGLWERSQASQRIKQLRGNPEAVASAYSLDDYRIADDLGGEGSFEDLKARAWARGIRITSDMVPNHMGIDSRWVVEHPDWFISLPEPPYPAYSFTGPDLSPDGRVALRIEDHYFDNTDAAVVFQRVDTQTGDVRYLYHGNDGTSMPWNDTAQLDYLRADVREAVIQTILAVARRSPVIRFDAAMTLAKRHIERLWYPEPGHAGGIPSRAEHALPKPQFEAAMPVEFWREVVDRVAAEVPDTLLLAEAFWLMEGYFVRTLGMHRVYNSAFMNMLRDEQNAQYRAVMRNTLEFDPEVLKRYVNFMNNPDEKTAVEQFGKGDKYFGIATVMATMPGLPMFGHGQIEGYTEKYGMEYRRAYWDERPDPWLVERHEREITPLLHRRALFAHVDEFLLYDFVADDGSVVEDVFAYSNRRGADRSLVVYHNRYGSTSGRIRESVPYAERSGDGAGAEKRLRRRTLADGLGLAVDIGRFVILRDRRAGLEYLRGARELADGGLRMDLGAYDCRVFLDLVEVVDSPGRPYGRLAGELGGRGVPSVEDAMRAILLRPVREPLERLLEPAAMESWRAMAGRRAPDGEEGHLRSELAAHVADLLDAASGFVGGDGVRAAASAKVEARLAAGIRRIEAADIENDADLVALAAHLVTSSLPLGLGKATAGSASADVRVVREWIDAWGLNAVIAEAFRCAGLDEAGSWRAVDVVKALAVVRGGVEVTGGAEIVEAWRNDDAAARAIGVNEHRGVRWFGREPWEQAVRWWSLAAQAGGAPRVAVDAVARQLRQAAVSSGYRLDDLVAVLEGRPISAADAPRTSIAVRPTPAGAPPAGAPRADRPSR